MDQHPIQGHPATSCYRNQKPAVWATFAREPPRAGGRDIPLYELHVYTCRYVPHQRVRVWAVLVRKWIIVFSHFGLKLGRASLFIRFFIFIRKTEEVKSFDVISVIYRIWKRKPAHRQMVWPGLKTGMENYLFWSEIGTGFGELGELTETFLVPIMFEKDTFIPGII